MMTSRQNKVMKLCAVALLAIALAACGSSTDPDKGSAKGKKSRTTVVADAGASTQDMVAGVSAGKGGPPVDLKFELHAKPQAGQLLEIDVAVLPTVPAIQRIFAKFQGGDGFDLVDGGELPSIDKPAPGTVIRHTLRVLPKQDGIYSVGATVSVEMVNDSITRVYSLPVIVGDGMPDATAKAEVPDRQAKPGIDLKTH